MITIAVGKDYRSKSDVPLSDAVKKYYEESYWDYRTTWTGRKDLAIHYGYWDQATESHSHSLLNMNREMANAIGIKESDKVLDAGCGVGGSALWLSEKFGCNVTGISLSASQIEMAIRNASRRRDKNTAFLIGDMTRLPMVSASVDVVWCTESVCHVTDKGEFLREAYRVLKSGGRLICSDGYAARDQFTLEQWQTIQICLDGWQIPNLYTPSQFADAMKAAGFSNVGFRNITENIMPSARRLYDVARFTQPMQTVMRALKLRSDAQTGNFNTALNQYYIFKDGMAIYGHSYGIKP